jgi:hypothetical protein
MDRCKIAALVLMCGVLWTGGASAAVIKLACPAGDGRTAIAYVIDTSAHTVKSDDGTVNVAENQRGDKGSIATVEFVRKAGNRIEWGGRYRSDQDEQVRALRQTAMQAYGNEMNIQIPPVTIERDITSLDLKTGVLTEGLHTSDDKPDPKNSTLLVRTCQIGP